MLIKPPWKHSVSLTLPSRSSITGNNNFATDFSAVWAGVKPTIWKLLAGKHTLGHSRRKGGKMKLIAQSSPLLLPPHLCWGLDHSTISPCGEASSPSEHTAAGYTLRWWLTHWHRPPLPSHKSFCTAPVGTVSGKPQQWYLQREREEPALPEGVSISGCKVNCATQIPVSFVKCS